jgi:hypothetical protein
MPKKEWAQTRPLCGNPIQAYKKNKKIIQPSAATAESFLISLAHQIHLISERGESDTKMTACQTKKEFPSDYLAV